LELLLKNKMINNPNIEQVKILIKRTVEKPIIVKAQDESFNRKILEYGRFNILLFFQENKNRKDKPKQLDSSLNHILAEISKKNNVSIGFDLGQLRNLDKKEKALSLARIKQDIKLCRKAKVKISLINCKDKISALNLLLSLGASTQQTKGATN